MTDKQRKGLLRYIGMLARNMNLADWQIYLRPEPTEDSNHAATVSCVPGRKIAHIQLAADWFEQDHASQRHVLVHELLHIHLDQEFQLIEDVVPELIGAAAYLTFEKAYRNLHEHGVDAIASALAPHFPVPVE